MCQHCNGRGFYKIIKPEDYKKVVNTQEYRQATKDQRREMLAPYWKLEICPTAKKRYSKLEEHLEQVKNQRQEIRTQNSGNIDATITHEIQTESK